MALAVLLLMVLAGCVPAQDVDFKPVTGFDFKPLGIDSRPVKSEISTYDTTFTASEPSATPEKNWELSLYGTRKGGFKVHPDIKTSKPYFIEFRARSAYSYGHASVVFGKLDKNGNVPVDRNGVLIPSMVQISGLHPATNDPKQWLKGHSVPVPAETGPSDGDFEDKYVTARYRVDLTEREFREVVRIVGKHKVSYNYWYAPNYSTNCLGYIGSIAKDIGLKVPAVPLLPKDYVKTLRMMNT
jgi:hypothetical protein